MTRIFFFFLFSFSSSHSFELSSFFLFPSIFLSLSICLIYYLLTNLFLSLFTHSPPFLFPKQRHVFSFFFCYFLFFLLFSSSRFPSLRLYLLRSSLQTHMFPPIQIVLIFIVDSILLKGFIQIGTLSTETIHQHCLSKL